jgi:hypothetical protein
MKLPSEILDVCREQFGTYGGGGRWSPPNRCDSCPLRTPCLANGHAPAHTIEQLEAARATFVAAANEIITATSSSAAKH